MVLMLSENKMRVLIACEFTGITREAFRLKGHDAWSCDILPTEIEGNHFQCDVREVLNNNWDLMIAHPPCTHLALSGARWFKSRLKEQEEALEFVKLLLNAPIEKICLENPMSIISSRIRKRDQVIQPYEYGHPEKKQTWLWLKNLPQLKPTKKVPILYQRIHRMAPSPTRSKERSRSYTGIAQAMAEQWG